MGHSSPSTASGLLLGDHSQEGLTATGMGRRPEQVVLPRGSPESRVWQWGWLQLHCPSEETEAEERSGSIPSYIWPGTDGKDLLFPPSSQAALCPPTSQYSALSPFPGSEVVLFYTCHSHWSRDLASPTATEASHPVGHRSVFVESVRWDSSPRCVCKALEVQYWVPEATGRGVLGTHRGSGHLL